MDDSKEHQAEHASDNTDKTSSSAPQALQLQDSTSNVEHTSDDEDTPTSSAPQASQVQDPTSNVEHTSDDEDTPASLVPQASQVQPVATKKKKTTEWLTENKVVMVFFPCLKALLSKSLVDINFHVISSNGSMETIGFVFAIHLVIEHIQDQVEISKRREGFRIVLSTTFTSLVFHLGGRMKFMIGTLYVPSLFIATCLSFFSLYVIARRLFIKDYGHGKIIPKSDLGRRIINYFWGYMMSILIIYVWCFAQTYFAKSEEMVGWFFGFFDPNYEANSKGAVPNPPFDVNENIPLMTISTQTTQISSLL